MTDEELIDRLRSDVQLNEVAEIAADRIEELRQRTVIAEAKLFNMQTGIREILEKWVSPVSKKGMN
jgi:hypothetical protein